MYYGRMTKELENLYSEYEKVWGHDPSGCLDAEYDEDEYDEYVADIKKALQMGVKLPNIYTYEEDED